MSEYRLDRTAFKAQTAEEAVKSQADYSRALTWQERLRIANYLNNVAYNYPENSPPNWIGQLLERETRLKLTQRKMPR